MRPKGTQRFQGTHGPRPAGQEPKAHAGPPAGRRGAHGPEPVRQKDFARALGRALGRPAVMPAPAFALRLALGEFADEGLLAGQRCVPRRLREEGYAFHHESLAGALDACVG